MLRIIFYLAILVIQNHGMDESDCTEPQLLVKDTYCYDSNSTKLTMLAITKELLADNLTKAINNDGCSIINDEYLNLNSTFYIECETEDVDCQNEENTPDKVVQNFFVECEEPETICYSLQDIPSKGFQVITGEDKPEPVPLTIILVSSLVGGCTAAAIGFGIYKLKTILQSGSYLVPGETCSGGFSEMP